MRRLPAHPARLRGRAHRGGGRLRIAHFLEASSTVLPGPYDVSLVEGSITTPEDAQRIRRVREQSTVLVTIGACATAGGVQALRNGTDIAEFRSVVYASPLYVDTLATSTPIAAHVPVDLELRGCPRQAPAAGDDLRAARGPEAGPPRHKRLHRVQAPGADVRDGRERHPVPRPGHARGLRRALPRRARGCYGCSALCAAPTSPRWSKGCARAGWARGRSTWSCRRST